MTSMAILTCRPNSHPFQERRVLLTEAMKIGRSVARARPAPNNCIFDCKVLSRNHALLWFENSKFFLQDTKSSNGTFVNNQRLSKGSEESPAHEIHSGDIIQFGVDVMENSRKVTHGCIIAQIHLYNPDGTEFKPRNGMAPGPTLPLMGPPSVIQIQAQDLYQLQQYLQEAAHREQMLENKLATLQRVMAETQEASESSWQALIDEDRLLSRLEVLESQLQAFAKNQTEESLRKELVALQEDKHTYENTAKESLRRIFQEKLEIVTKLSDTERTCSNVEDECTHLKESYEMSQEELKALAAKHSDKLKDLQELSEKMRDAERKHGDATRKTNQDKEELEKRIRDLSSKEENLLAKLEALQAENDFSKEQLSAMKTRLEQNQDSQRERPVEDQEVQVDISAENNNEDDEPDITIPITVQLDYLNNVEMADASTDALTSQDLTETTDRLKEIVHFKTSLLEKEEMLEQSRQRMEDFKGQLDRAQEDANTSAQQVADLEEKLSSFEDRAEELVESALTEIRRQLEESQLQNEAKNEIIKQLKDKLSQSERQNLQWLRKDLVQKETMGTELSNHVHDNASSAQTEQMQLDSRCTTELRLRDELIGTKETLRRAEDRSSKSVELEARLIRPGTEECTSNSGLQTEEKTTQNGSLNDISFEDKSELEELRAELTAAQSDTRQRLEEICQLREQLQEAQSIARERSNHCFELQDQLNKAEGTAHDVKQQILALRDRLIEEERASKENHQEAKNLKEQLVRAQQSSKESQNEAEKLRGQLQECQCELERLKVMQDNKDNRVRKNSEQGGRNKEMSYKEECGSLKKRVQALEEDLNRTRKETTKLTAEVNRFEAANRELEMKYQAQKDKTDNKAIEWRMELNEAHRETDKSRQECGSARAEVELLQERLKNTQRETDQLKDDLKGLKVEYKMVATRSRNLMYLCLVPMGILAVAMMLVLFPALLSLTSGEL
ncbi:sarcolemmal membrane-associated protein-like isoform X3 [Branchiostoma lanceolatum]|uniref:sarcolemmal membrane-associated protein-like isoform X3 n=1 Tax=Branchiostoma lanceolatum TaxID=7740 RepID=UPI0034521571